MYESKLSIAVTEEEIKAAINAKAEEYKEIYKGEKLIIVAELSGVFVFLADFLRALELDVLIQFVAFDKIADKKQIELDLESAVDFKDANVLIVSDVFYKGNSLKRLV